MRFTGEAKILAGSALFALIPVAVLYGKELGTFGLLFGRLAVAVIVLFFAIKNKRMLFQRLRQSYKILFLWSCMMFGAMYCYFISIEQSSVSISSALLGTQPALVALFAMLLLKEKIKPIHISTITITLLGIFLITGSNFTSDSKFAVGEMLALLSAALLALNFVFQKKYLLQFSGQELVFFQSLFQLPLILPFLLVSKGSLGSHSLIAIMILGIVCTTLAYSLIYAGIKEVHPHKIGVLQSFEYVIPVFIGLYFYHEQISLGAMIGIGLVIIGCAIAGLYKSVEPKYPPISNTLNKPKANPHLPSFDKI